MSTVNFGINNINKPTPALLNTWVRVFTVVAGIFMGWMQTNNLIGAHAQASISSILGLMIAICNGVAPLFGVDIQQATVPKEDVASVKNDGK